MISSIYNTPPIIPTRVGRPALHLHTSSRSGRGYKVRVYLVDTTWTPADCGYVPARDRGHAISQSKLYRTFNVAVQRVSDGETGAVVELWFAQFLTVRETKGKS